MTPDQFRAARLSLGLTQVQLSAEWGMTNNGARTIRRWENGERAVSRVAAYAIRLMVTVKNSA